MAGDFSFTGHQRVQTRCDTNRLVVQRDPIQTAKLVASIDQVSRGRFLFGVGGGWNAEEIEDHGTAFKTRFKLMRERIEAMKEIWTKETAEYHGEFVNFATMKTWPKPVQKHTGEASAARRVSGCPCGRRSSCRLIG